MPAPDRATALVITKSDPGGDPRPRRMIGWLRESFLVRIISARSTPLEPDVVCVPLTFDKSQRLLGRFNGFLSLALRRHHARIWSRGRCDLVFREASLSPSFISVHDLDLLPLALAIRDASPRPGRVFFDAREYYPRHFEDRWLWRLLFQPFNRHLAQTYLPRTDIMVTVSAGLAREYEREFALPCGVLPSYSEHWNLSPFSPSDESVRMIHHGFAHPSRHIERMIDAVRLLPERFSLDLMLVGKDSAYMRRLRRHAADLPRVRFPDPVPFAEIIPRAHAYDVGVFLAPPVNFNLRHTLPNKFFEFIQSRLAVAIGPSPEMAAYVEQYGCGIVSDDFTPASFAASLATLTTADLVRLKNNSHRAAAELNTNTLRDRVLSAALRGAGAEAFPL